MLSPILTKQRDFVKITKDLLLPYLIYNTPFQYDKHITLCPVTMDNVLLFQVLSQSVTVRKNSVFHDKKIIKMSYLDFLVYCIGNDSLEDKYKITGLSQYYFNAVQLLQLCCKDAEIKINQQNAQFSINDEIITPQVFDDLRRIIIIQNDIDFNIDEFLNYDTEQQLLAAADKQNKDKANIEDYIDSLVIALNTTEDKVKNMTIRKFWRYIKRYQLHEGYVIAKTGETSGMVKFKEPIKHWIISLDEDDKYKHLKTDENELRNKIN